MHSMLRGSRSSRRRSGAVLVAALLAAVLAVAGCGGGGSDGGDSGGGGGATRTTTPEERIVPDSEVTAGLATLQRQAEEAESLVATDPAAAEKAAGAAHETWEGIEGTIKKNETDMYLRFEDALSDLNLGAQKGDVEQAQRGARDLRETASDYLAAHP